MSKRFNETRLISFPCCRCPDLSEWMITFMYEGSGPPAFIATHFGKILPVLAVNSEAPFVWKIFRRATHNMSDCRFLWNPSPNSNPSCILSFPVTYEEGKQLCLTYNHFFFFSPTKKNFAHRIMLCASRMASAVEVPLSGENSFFPVISLGCGVEPLFGGGFALPHLCGVIKPLQRTFVKETVSGLGC